MVKVGPDYPRQTVPHVRIVAGGTLGQTKTEIWSCTMKVTDFQVQGTATIIAEEIIAADVPSVDTFINGLISGTSGSTALDTYADTNAVPAWKAFMPFLDGRAALTYVKVNAYGADDKQINTTTIDRQFTAVPGGSGGTGPFTESCVIEFRTSHKSRGTASHGRIQIPSNMQVDGNGQSVTYNQNTLIQQTNGITAFLTKLNGNSSTGHQMLPAIIYTQLVGAPYKHTTVDRTPRANAIDNFLLSSLPGITRRRGNKLKQGGVLTPINYGSTN